MTFQRTQSALASLRLFYKVDVVVFCEGGPSRTFEEALLHTIDGRTLDTIYWANFIGFQSHSKSFHIKSVGDKATLKKIAEDVIATNTTSVTVCVDADYDVHLQRMMQGSRVACTFGYSWESDVLQTGVIERVLTHLVGPPPAELRQAVNDAVQRLSDDLTRWCEIDIALKARSKPCVFDREKPLSVVNMQLDPPWICATSLQRRLTNLGYQRRPRRVVVVQATAVLLVAYGKLVGRLLYHIVVKIASRIVPRLRIDYDGFMRIAISETFALLRAGNLPAFQAHIAAQRSAFA